MWWAVYCSTWITWKLLETRRNSRRKAGKVATIDQITIKTPNTKCLFYWCLIEFIDWRYSQSCWCFRPLLKLTPLYLLSSSPPPPPLPCENMYRSIQSIQCLTGGKWIGLCGEHIQELYTVYLTRFRTYKIVLPPQTRTQEGRGPQTDASNR